VVRMITERMGRRFEDITRMVPERRGQDAAYVIDSSLTRRELAWAPQIALSAGIEEVLDWVQKHWEDISCRPLAYEHKA
jgi:dTDP-D-glucose 4,6-dehydratase